MIEFVLLWLFGKKLSAIATAKGRSRHWWILGAVTWISLELSVLIFARRHGLGIVSFLPALVAAGLGAWLSWAVVKRLPPKPGRTEPPASGKLIAIALASTVALLLMVALVAHRSPELRIWEPPCDTDEYIERETLRLMEEREAHEGGIVRMTVERVDGVAPSKGRVVVVVLQDGNPVVGASVLLTPRGDETITAKTDADGLTEFDDLVPGNYRCTLTADGLSDGPYRDVELKAGQKRTLVYNLTAGWAVAGRVALSLADCTAEEPQPVNARLQIISTRGAMESYLVPVTSDGDFSARLPSGPYSFFASSSNGRRLISFSETAVDQDQSELCLVLKEHQSPTEDELDEMSEKCHTTEPDTSNRLSCAIPAPEQLACSLHGRVADSDGVPVAGVTIYAHSLVETDREKSVLMQMYRARQAHGGYQRTTALDGSFSYEEIACVTTSVSAFRLNPLGCGFTWVELSPDASEAKVEIEFSDY